MASFAVGGYLFFQRAYEESYRAAIPSAYGLGKRFWRSDITFNPFQGCGIGVFDLDPRTIETIKRGGLAYLLSLPKRTARERWEGTPAPEHWIDNEIGEGDGWCYEGLDTQIFAKLKAAASRGGSYYTVEQVWHDRSSPLLLVMPEDGLIAYRWQ
ncbi:hypothetical protein SCD90_16550 [Terrihabitans sp. PJ23]|uniref:Uncharacterized protein n=1 Tax=Terrihabitans rhizophilus TaxID=3092662 RepID=A0ABU4RS39_9HYPH|nr:hypothetical protein [Terrihabitans sp. PJ23]